jgi:hypothetical protein
LDWNEIAKNFQEWRNGFPLALKKFLRNKGEVLLEHCISEMDDDYSLEIVDFHQMQSLCASESFSDLLDASEDFEMKLPVREVQDFEDSDKASVCFCSCFFFFFFF